MVALSHECSSSPFAPTATDNCGDVIVGIPDVNFPITAIGATVVTWTFTDACENTVTQSQSVNVTVLNTEVTQTDSSLTAKATDGTYQWLDCDNGYAQISEANKQTFVVASNGSYAVEVTKGSCVDTSTCVSFIMTNSIQQWLKDHSCPAGQQRFLVWR